MAEEVKEPLFNWVDSERINNIDDYAKKDFKKEIDLCDYIESNINSFAKDVLELSCNFSYEREWNLNSYKRFGSRQKRVDFYIKTKNKNIIIECKNPKSGYSELLHSISQILAYSCIARNNGIKIDRRVIIVNKYDPVIRDIIRDFKLPIEVYILSKSSILKLMVDEN